MDTFVRSIDMAFANNAASSQSTLVPNSVQSSNYPSSCDLSSDGESVDLLKSRLQPPSRAASPFLTSRSTSPSIPDEKHEPMKSKTFDHVIATKDQLESLQKTFPLRRPKGNDESINQLRHGFFSAYRRIFTVVFVANLIVMVVALTIHGQRPKRFTYADASTASGANVLLTVLVRHEHVVNALFRIATSLPHSTPLYIRRQAAKIYSYGGVHSGCGLAAFVWYIVFAVMLALYASDPQCQLTTAEYCALAATTGTVLLILSVIVTMSHPSFRIRYHDAWEWSHRFGGWTAVAILWAQTIVMISSTARQSHRSFGATMLITPGLWFIAIITACLIYPWLRLRKRTVTAKQLSDHALKLTFNHKHFAHPGCATRLTDAPLKETHGFAVLPNVDGEQGYSCVISNAGDWTRKMIQQPPKHVWVRGSITFGALNVAVLFKPVVIVATGSGIAPCLSYLQTATPGFPMRVLWSARFPEATYGPEIMGAVVKSDPNAVIIDTKKTGTPDMVALTWALYKQSNAEAIVIISNAKVTREVVYGLESRGVPAFGAIFDS